MKNNERYLIGMDWSTDPSKRGIGLGVVKGDRLEVLDLHKKSRKNNDPEICKVVGKWISKHNPVLICIDAPLGWPVTLGRQLQNHYAGNKIANASEFDSLFSRTTDRYIEKVYSKKSLEVGANLIARTAASSLSFISMLREETSMPIPLNWIQGTECTEASIIEVYPAATLLSHNCQFYKEKDKELSRKKLTGWLKDKGIVSLSQNHINMCHQSHDVLDAVICLLAGKDFLRGKCIEPACLQGVRDIEGWIWVKKKICAFRCRKVPHPPK